jgi:hypothetical protein
MRYQIIEVAPDGTEEVLQTVNTAAFAADVVDSLRQLVPGGTFRIQTVTK